MDQNKLVELMAGILASDNKWRGEVEANIMLQNSLEELFVDPLFQRLMELRLIPKFQKTYIPHFRAVELILAVREAVRQMYEDGAGNPQVERQLDDFQLKTTDKFRHSGAIDVNGSLEKTLEEAAELAGLYHDDPQFSARLDNFRLLVLPLSVERDGSDNRYQLLVLENIRPPRKAWTMAK